MAGLLFFEDRTTTFATYHQITSKDARNLVGTMYLPNSKLLIDSRDPVADRSDDTIIIARKFELRDGPELVLNTDDADSDSPVPDGVGNNTSSSIRLSRCDNARDLHAGICGQHVLAAFASCGMRV